MVNIVSSLGWGGGGVVIPIFHHISAILNIYLLNIYLYFTPGVNYFQLGRDNLVMTRNILEHLIKAGFCSLEYLYIICPLFCSTYL